MKYQVVQLPRVSDVAFSYENKFIPWLRHSVYAWAGLRPALAQHTAAEHAAIKKWAAGRSSLVEIGVAEGVSALAMREAMNENATLYLIDPFHLSRFPALNFVKRTARRAVASCPRGNVVWIDKFSYDAVRTWNAGVDLLMIDGDHSEQGVQRDWDEWSPFVTPGGAVIFHDARIFEEGWTTAADGPVKLVDRFFRNGGSSDWEIVDEIHSLVVVRRQTRLAP
jgi:predicted O-methyltransferase YrrM